MGLTVGHLNLYSQKPKELAHFFSELLDLDILPEKGGDGIWVQSSSVKFFITQASAEQLFHKAGERDVMVEFSLPELSQLEDLIHKVQFMSYRKIGDKTRNEKSPQKSQLSKVGNKVFFKLKDPDGRTWQFSYLEEL